MPPTKNQLVHGSRISCEIDGVKIDDARISISVNNILICQNIHYGFMGSKLVIDSFGYIYAFRVIDEDITSDKYKIRLVEEPKNQAERCKCGETKVNLSVAINKELEQLFDKEEEHECKVFDMEFGGGSCSHPVPVCVECGESIITNNLVLTWKSNCIYYPSKPKEITVEEAEKLLEGKYKII